MTAMYGQCAFCGGSLTNGHSCPQKEAEVLKIRGLGRLAPYTAMEQRILGTRWHNIGEAATCIHAWANKAFPDRVPESSLSKLVLEEIPELLIARKEGRRKGELSEELADCFILLLDLAEIWGVDIAHAIYLKMRKNERRSWVRDDATGFYNHIEEHVDDEAEGSRGPAEGVRREAVDDSESDPRTDCSGAPISGMGVGAVLIRSPLGWHTSQLVREGGRWILGACARCGRDLDGGFAVYDQGSHGRNLAGDTEEAEGTGVG